MPWNYSEVKGHPSGDSSVFLFLQIPSDEYLTVTKATPLRYFYAPKGAKMHSKYDCSLDNVVLYVRIVQNSEDQRQELLKIS